MADRSEFLEAFGGLSAFASVFLHLRSLKNGMVLSGQEVSKIYSDERPVDLIPTRSWCRPRRYTGFLIVT